MLTANWNETSLQRPHKNLKTFCNRKCMPINRWSSFWDRFNWTMKPVLMATCIRRPTDMMDHFSHQNDGLYREVWLCSICLLVYNNACKAEVHWNVGQLSDRWISRTYYQKFCIWVLSDPPTQDKELIRRGLSSKDTLSGNTLN